MVVFDHAASAQPDDAAGPARQVEVVGHGDQGRPGFLVQFKEQAFHGSGRIGVEIARRFVHEEQSRTVDEGPGHGDPLLFAPGQLHRVVGGPVRQPHAVQEFLRPAVDRLFTAQFGRDHDIFETGECRDELEILEDEAHVTVAYTGPFIFIEIVQHDAVQ